MEEKPFRILSIDGGGIRGVLPCSFLAELEKDLINKHGADTRLCDYFDLVAGTSTGGIIALAISLGIPMQTISNLYLKNGNNIFPKNRRFMVSKFLNIIIGKPFYARENLRNLISDTFKTSSGKQAKLREAKTFLICPTYDMEKRQVHLFKTPHCKGIIHDKDILAVDVALSTSAAPAYFLPYSFGSQETIHEYNLLIDGGIIANNPTLLAYIEATQGLKIKPEKLHILSLGTGQNNKPYPKHYNKCHPWFWVNPFKGPRLYEVMAEAQSISIDNTMKILQKGVAGQNETELFVYERIQKHYEQSEKLGLDSASSLDLGLLSRYGKQLYHDKSEIIKNKFSID